MTSRAPTTQRSLFCECNKTPCVCWPSTSSTRPRTRSRPQQPSAAVATAWPHYEAAPAQQLPSPHTPSGSHTSPVVRPRPSSLTVPANNAVPTSHTTATSPRSPRTNQLQLHGLFKAPSILRTPESPSAFRIRWDVRDASTASVLVSNHEPEHLYAHPASVAYATSPPVPFLMVAYDGALPWLAPVHAQPGSAGVTVRDVLDAVSAVLHTQVDKDTLRQLPTDEARKCVYQAYYGRVERQEADNRGILAVDFLGDKSLFVSLERDEALTRKRVKEEHLWPYVFALKLKLRKGALVSDA